jgi:lysine 2,3-aminomutase
LVRESGKLKLAHPARSSWKAQLARTVRRPEDLPASFRLLPEEQGFFAAQPHCRSVQAPPFAVTGHVLSLIDPGDPRDPIRRQFFPREEELVAHPEELEDPLGEDAVLAVPGLLHRYPDRVLLLATDRCAAYCRHCFRRRNTRGRRAPQSSPEEFQDAVAYVGENQEVRELILSGGDPLLFSDERLQELFARFRRTRPELAFRIHTRLPVVLPERVTPELAALLSGFRPLRVVIQVNHPRELAEECLQAVRRFIEAGIAVLNQCVLLKGVNDDPKVLAELFRAQASAGIRPYYLFQPDLAMGTGHLRPSLMEGLRLFEAVGRLCPEELLPRYVRDVPGGGGKVALTPAVAHG